MVEQEQSIVTLSPYEIDRACLLARVTERFLKLDRKLRRLYKPSMIETFRDMDGKVANFTITPDFMFRVYRIERSLIDDLENEGWGGLADEIVDHQKEEFRKP